MPKASATRTRPTATAPKAERGSWTGWIIGGAVALIVVVAAVIAVVVAGGGTDTSGLSQNQPVNIAGQSLPPYADSATDPAVGMIAPSINGASFDGSALNVRPGTPTLLVFLAHWCPHCQREVPVLTDWAASGQVPDGVDVVGIATATDKLRPNYPPSSWLADEEFPFPVIADSESSAAAEAYGLSGYPFFVLLDADGAVVARTSGEVDPATLTSLLSSVAA